MGQRSHGSVIVIATCADDDYLPLVWPLARSIGLANGLGRAAVLHVFHSGTDLDLAARLNGLRVLRLHVEVHAVDKDETGLYRVGGLPPTTYLRLHLPDLLPNESRVIYLDTDTMAMRSLGPLFDAELRGNPVGAVQDILLARPSVRLGAAGFSGSVHQYFEQVLGIPHDPDRFGYVNSGVLLMELDQLRNERFPERAIQRSRELAPVTIWHDQDAINSLLAGRVTFLSSEWNVIPDSLLVELEGPDAVQAEFRRQSRRQFIVHFAGTGKPWRFAAVPFAAHWQALALFSPATRLMQWPGLMGYLVSRRISFARRLARTHPRLFAFAFGLWKRWQRRTD